MSSKQEMRDEIAVLRGEVRDLKAHLAGVRREIAGLVAAMTDVIGPPDEAFGGSTYWRCRKVSLQAQVARIEGRLAEERLRIDDLVTPRVEVVLTYSNGEQRHFPQIREDQVPEPGVDYVWRPHDNVEVDMKDVRQVTVVS